ncbi:MAG: hypothetical protein A2W99_16475 [Bacteroidetes bacterium GWF2_33_16]|nr:MAG: hypothetical protein A2W99_16475 [Bacteroidetes bacterium GWF2_33_16]
MKKLLTLIIICCLFQSKLESKNNQEIILFDKIGVQIKGNPNFCIEGILEFFKIVDILKKDEMPTDEMWSTFIESPGYKELARLEFGKNYFRDLLTVIFKPSEKEKLNEVIEKYKKKGDYYSWALLPTIEGFREAEKNRSELLDFAAYLSSAETLREVENYVSEYLSNAQIDSSFKINFIVFNDSRGYDPVIIGITNPGKYTVVEINCLKERGQNNYYPTVLLLAHEAFHHIRNKSLVYKEPNGPDRQILWALNKIENEGIADLINVLPLNEKEGCFYLSEQAKNIEMEQKAQYAIINTLNYLLTEISRNEELTPNLSGAVNNIVPRSGHPTGYYMAKVIYNEFGKEYIKSIATNPFQFFVAYNEAAKNIKDAPLFSQEAMDYIKKLEKKYSLK